MSPAHRRYLFLEQGVGAAVVNLLINAGIAALLFRGHAIVPLWGQQSIAGDTIGTTFLLPLLTCLIVTPLARRQVRAGRLAVIEWTRESHPMLGWLPGGTVQRAFVLGVICTVIVAPLAVSALSALHITAMSFWRFLTFKAIFAALLGAAVTPVIALWAITGACPEGDAGGSAAPHRAE
jgi:hypothetical protein